MQILTATHSTRYAVCLCKVLWDEPLPAGTFFQELEKCPAQTLKALATDEAFATFWAHMEQMHAEYLVKPVCAPAETETNQKKESQEETAQEPERKKRKKDDTDPAAPKKSVLLGQGLPPTRKEMVEFVNSSPPEGMDGLKGYAYVLFL